MRTDVMPTSTKKIKSGSGDMRFARVLLMALAAGGVSLAPAASFATEWHRAGETRAESNYPYANLPGVKAQPDLKDEEQYSCRTETRALRRGYNKIFRTGGLPTLVYVCDRDGVESVGTQVPLRGHYQPVR
jgi:hypothetical protein